MKEQLDQLARDVHEWPANTRYGRGHEVFEEGAEFHDDYVIVLFVEKTITRQQWLDRRAELQNKPSWKDAPEWALWLAQDECGMWYWYAGEPIIERYVFDSRSASSGAVKGEVLGDWRDTLEERPAFHDGGHVTEYPTEHPSACAVLESPADLSDQAVTARLQEATDNVLAAVPELKFEQFTSLEDAQPELIGAQLVGVDTLHTVHHAAFLHQGCQLLMSEPELVVFRTADGELIHCKPEECLIDPDVYGLAARLLSDMSGHPVAPEHMRELVEQMGWHV